MAAYGRVTLNRGGRNSRFDCMCNDYFAAKLTENAVIYKFSLSNCHFFLIFLEEEVTSPY